MIVVLVSWCPSTSDAKTLFHGKRKWFAELQIGKVIIELDCHQLVYGVFGDNVYLNGFGSIIHKCGSNLTVQQ